MRRRSRRCGVVFAIGLALAWLAPTGVAIAQTEIKVSHFLPAVHGLHVDFLEPWARELERRSDGAVRVSIIPGGGALGNIQKQYDQVAVGVVDIALGLHGIPRGRFPRTSIIALPFMTASADAATRALWDVFPEHLAGEYRGVRVLALFAHNGGMIHTRDRRVTSADDLAGLRIRAPSPEVNRMLEHFGATPVGMPPGEVYESLQRGVLDGSIFPWDPVRSFRLAEVVRYHLEIGCYTVPFYLVMNQRAYDRLPEAAREALDAITGDYLVERFGDWWDKWDDEGRAEAIARGNEITALTAEQRAEWEARLEPMIEEWLDELEAAGIDDARAIHQAMKERIAVHESGS